MKFFNKINVYFLVIVILSLNLNAAKNRGEYATKNFEGQNSYLKNCSSCHGEGSRGGNMASIREWKNIFSNNAIELLYFHEEDDESKKLNIYIKSDTFKKQSKEMLKFLQEFAYDSEHIPTCN
ncbi:MAG: hypothetical protein C0625_17220 [Arcobacter sp.]|nr:MAG: hypothetical protein C0625_17220 [Arcobacter sp.]